ncbi:MAG: hypothetical protein HYW57_07985 [Ignavibacteriales bacterium]|nr:hypothetical protein [Ignavibacteriales bacterium]
MIEQLTELYSQSGEWGNPIALVTAILFVAGWVMLFTVRLVKKFILYSIVALLLPNSIGFVGYLESVEDLPDAILERGEELSEEMVESVEDLSFSPLYLGLIGGALTLLPGVIGILKSARRRPDKHPDSSQT